MSPSTLRPEVCNYLNVMSRPESLAAMRQPSSLWDSMDMQVMFEIRAPDDSTVYSIYAPTQ